jgi:hypothetical protein
MKLGTKISNGWRKVSREITAFVIFVNVLFLFLGTMLFFMGYHNADLGQNIRWLNADLASRDFNVSYGDTTLSNTFVSGQEGYRLGIMQMFYGFILILVYSVSHIPLKRRG